MSMLNAGIGTLLGLTEAWLLNDWFAVFFSKSHRLIRALQITVSAALIEPFAFTSERKLVASVLGGSALRLRVVQRDCEISDGQST